MLADHGRLPLIDNRVPAGLAGVHVLVSGGDSARQVSQPLDGCEIFEFDQPPILTT